MREAGSESWSVTVGGEQMEHAVLYVRDAYQLTPPASPDNPPPLADGVTVAALSLHGQDHADASAAWLEWWRRVVRFECATSRIPTNRAMRDPGQRQAQLRARDTVFDPPTFESLGASSALQLAAQRINRDALGWWNRERAFAGRPAEWQDAKGVAEEMIDTYQVSPSRVHATIVVLSVAREWSLFPAPGVAMCSASVIADSNLYVPLLRRAFESGLSTTRPQAD
jgi:hypothetical protein